MPSHETQTWINAGGLSVLLLMLPFLFLAVSNMSRRLTTLLTLDHVHRAEFESVRVKVEEIAERQAAVMALLKRNGIDVYKD